MGTKGQREPVDETQKRDLALRGTATMERDGESFISWTEGQKSCNGGRREKSRPGRRMEAEKLRRRWREKKPELEQELEKNL